MPHIPRYPTYITAPLQTNNKEPITYPQTRFTSGHFLSNSNQSDIEAAALAHVRVFCRTDTWHIHNAQSAESLSPVFGYTAILLQSTSDPLSKFNRWPSETHWFDLIFTNLCLCFPRLPY